MGDALVSLEALQKQVERNSFAHATLREIKELKTKLKQKIQSNRIMGNHYEANQTLETVKYLTHLANRIKRLKKA